VHPLIFLIENLSSLAGSALEEGKQRMDDVSLSVCREHLDMMAKQQSIRRSTASNDGAAADVASMSPIIRGMLKVSALAVPKSGCTWVVCAPTDQGKSSAAEFLMYGNHRVRPERSLKIDATNWTNFAEDFATFLNYSAAAPCIVYAPV
jgi:hypothetical protein